MKIAISNIAWDIKEEQKIAALLCQVGVNGVEIAPGKIGKKNLPTVREAKAYKAFWENKGIEIVAIQALLFRRDDLALFGSEEKHLAALRYLKKMISIAKILGAKTLVFGSPKNRKRGHLSLKQADDIAVPFFRELGKFALKNNARFCIEPNSPEYGADYITTAAEALKLVKKVNHPGFGLHLDAGGLILSKESAEIIIDGAKQLAHFHVSQPFLAHVTGADEKKHLSFARTLKRIGYTGWVSIEMKQVSPDRSNAPIIRRTIEFVKKIYE